MRVFFLIWLISVSLIKGQSLSELEILDRLVDNSLIPIQDFVVKDSVTSLKIKVISDDNKVHSLLRSKILSFIPYNDLSNNILEVVVNNYEIRYPAIISFPLFGEENLRREVELDLYYSLSRNEEVIFYHHFKNVYSDTILISEIKFKENETKHSNKIPTVPVWRSLVEPVIISSATGLIIFLFFTIRSK